MFSIWSGTHQGMDHRYQHPHLSPYPHPNYHPVPSVDDIGGSSEVHTSKENFLVKVDTRNFGPEQLLVKTLDGFLIVEGEHEERSEAAGHRFTTRKFARRFLLPVNCKEDELRCEIGSHGILKVTVPRDNPDGRGRLHAISHSGSALPHSGIHHLQGSVGHHGHQHGDAPLDATTWVSGINCNKHQFVVRLELAQFSPDEILVKTVDDFLVIEGKHEEKEDGQGFITRHFNRRYLLPLNVNKDEVVCEINAEGILKVTVPRVESEKGGHEKVHKLVRVSK